jgi:hypothetical protein
MVRQPVGQQAVAAGSLCLKFLEEARHLDRVLAGVIHDTGSVQVGLALSVA